MYRQKIAVAIGQRQNVATFSKIPSGANLMTQAENLPTKDYGRPRCLARLTDQEHQAILSAVRKSGLSVRKWLLAKVADDGKPERKKRGAK